MNHMTKGPLKDIAIKCLDDNPKKRPLMSSVCENIDSILIGKYVLCFNEVLMYVITPP